MLLTLWGPDTVVPKQTVWESPSSAAGLQEHQDPSQPCGLKHVAGWALGLGDWGAEDTSDSSACVPEDRAARLCLGAAPHAPQTQHIK